jgi:protein TonB
MRERVRFIPYDDPPVPKGGYSSIQRNLVYPKVAEEGGIEGTAVIHAFVSEDGVVTDTVVLRSVHPELDQAAINAIKKTQFNPAKQGRTAVGCWISIPVNFRLKG